MAAQPESRQGFEVAIICALPIEGTAIDALFETEWNGYGKQIGDPNAYTTGQISGHNVVLVHMPEMGKSNAASVAASLRSSFPEIKLVIMSGICGAVPEYRTSEGAVQEIVLGDVVISNGIVQYDLGRQYPDRFVRKDSWHESLPRPSPELRALISKLMIPKRLNGLRNETLQNLVNLHKSLRRSEYPGRKYDILLPPYHRHKHHENCATCVQSRSHSDPVCEISRTSPCSQLGCDSYTSPILRERHGTTPQPLVHLGKYASGDMVMKSGEDRDKIAERESAIAFEMEGAGVWDNFPCIIIKGACDYADSHKNKDFQGYAAATSAACTKAFLEEWFLASQSTQGGAHSEYTRPSPAIREIDIVALEIFGLPVSEANRRVVMPCAQALNLTHRIQTLAELESRFDEDSFTKRLETESYIKDLYQRAVGRCFQSFCFEHLMAREEIISRPESQTCRWIYGDPQYQRWVTNQDRLLWIKGIPGAGKSVLMKSLYEQRKLDLANCSTLLLRFFFNGRGSVMERSPEALYRTLIYNLITLDPTMLFHVLLLYLERENRGFAVRWKPGELANIFHRMLEEFQPCDIEILIDALDECSDNEVHETVRRFERSIQEPRNGTTLRVCWSSRFYPHISLVGVQGMEMVLNTKNSEDILRFARKTLPLDFSREFEFIGREIIRRANGAFLWASLVSQRLRRAFDAGDEIEELLDILKSIPDDLNNLLLEIFGGPGFTPDRQKSLKEIVCYVLGALHPLSVEELYAALVLGKAIPNWAFEDLTLTSADEAQFRKRIIQATRGLVEVIDLEKTSSYKESESVQLSIQFDRHSKAKPQSDRSGYSISRVQFIHESVREFFLDSGLPLLLVSSRSALIAECHLRLTVSGFMCLRGIAKELDIFTEVERGIASVVDDRFLRRLVPPASWKPPLLDFLVKYIKSHIFTHLDYFHFKESDEVLISSELCRLALYGYICLACYEVSQRHYLTKEMNRQLRLVLNHSKNLFTFGDTLADVLDLPNRLMVASTFFERRGIYMFGHDAHSIGVTTNEEIHQFIAVFSANFHQSNADPGTPKNSVHSSTSNNREEEGLRFGILFRLPLSMGARLALPGRLETTDYHSTDRDIVVFPVNITDWQIISCFPPQLQSIIPQVHYQSQQQLTFSMPNRLVCNLFRLIPAEGTAGQSSPVLLQTGQSDLRWENVPNSDRETLLEPLKRPSTWAYPGEGISGITSGRTPYGNCTVLGLA